MLGSLEVPGSLVMISQLLTLEGLGVRKRQHRRLQLIDIVIIFIENKL